jgi:nucleoside-diphosphate kinase
MVKPDGVARGLVGEIVGRLERKGLRLERLELRTLEREFAMRHYREHEGKGFFEDLITFITSGPVVASEWSGEGAIGVARSVIGATDPKQAAPGTIRGDFGLEVTFNLVHGSDGPESAARELALFFG